MVSIQQIITIARSAGDLLRQYFGNVKEYESKGQHDVVTLADLESESLIIKELQAISPDFDIVAEETGTIKGSSDYRWYVDPMDGTTNFLLGSPYFAVSIALALKDKAVMAVVYSPFSDEVFHAEKDKGAFLNGKQIKVSGKVEMQDALITMGYGAHDHEITEGLALAGRLALLSKRCVINFAPSVDLCNIARGRVDAYIDGETMPEDHAAGGLILSEAGGKISDFNHEAWNIDTQGVLAGTPAIFDSIQDILI